MSRLDTFVFRVNDDERRMIAVLADRLQRSQGDAVRFVIRQAAQVLVSEAAPSTPVTSMPQGSEVAYDAK